MRSTLTGWAFHIPNFSGNILTGLEAIDPNNSDRDVQVYLSESHNNCNVNLDVASGIQAHVSFP
jgi:hypothetical protein